MKLSQNFTLAELTRSSTAERLGLSNEATPEIVEALFSVAAMLENVREHLSSVAGKPIPIIVTSGYRSPAVNKAVGGVASSDHARGLAADIVASAFGSPHAVAKELCGHINALGIGQIILEGVKGKQWVHLSVAPPVNPINRVITITDAGVQTGIKELT